MAFRKTTTQNADSDRLNRWKDMFLQLFTNKETLITFSSWNKNTICRRWSYHLLYVLSEVQYKLKKVKPLEVRQMKKKNRKYPFLGSLDTFEELLANACSSAQLPQSHNMAWQPLSETSIAKEEPNGLGVESPLLWNRFVSSIPPNDWNSKKDSSVDSGLLP